MRLLPGGAGHAAITLQAKGAKVPMPAVSGVERLFRQEPRLAARLYASNGACWEAVYYPPHVRAHSGRRFDAETP